MAFCSCKVNSFQLIFFFCGWQGPGISQSQSIISAKPLSDFYLCDLSLFSFSFKFLLCCYLHTTVLHWIRSAIWWKWMGPLCWREMVFLLDSVWTSHLISVKPRLVRTVLSFVEFTTATNPNNRYYYVFFNRKCIDVCPVSVLCCAFFHKFHGVLDTRWCPGAQTTLNAQRIS